MRSAIWISFIILFSNHSFSKTNKKSVFVESVSKKEVFDSYSYPARVESKVSSIILANSSGVVKKINYTLGTNVKRSEVLAKIKHTDPVYNYNEYLVRSQVNGVISKIFVTQGALVSKGAKLFTVTSAKEKKIVIEVSAKDLGIIKVGEKGTFESNKTEYKVEIIGMSPFLDPATGSATAELKIIDTKPLTIGQLGKVKFKSNLRKAFILPESALVYRGDKTYVREVNDKNIVKKILVKTGNKKRGNVEILEGLSEKQNIVVKSSGFLADGYEVEVKRNKESENI